MDKVCSVEGCNVLLVARGMCSKHYQQWRKSSSTCTVHGCDNGDKARGLCAAHYANLLKYGEPVRLKFFAPHTICDVEDCFDPTPRNGIYCKAHLVQLRRTGEPPKSRRVKICNRCGHQLDYYANRPNAVCRPCKDYYHATKHGITGRRYWEMGEEQGWCCYTCGNASQTGRGRLHIDHDHSHCPGTFGCVRCVRRLICHECNTAIGLLRENAVVIQRVADYLKEFPPLDPAHLRTETATAT